MTNALQDPAVLRHFGQTPDEARTRLKAELDAFEQHLQKREADWTRTQPEREWSPAQEAEHVMKINDSITRVLGLLLSDKELRPVPQTVGELRGGKRVAPAFSEPSAAGLSRQDWQTQWATHREALEKVAAGVRETPQRTFWHQYYGELDALNWLRMVNGHLYSHRQLLEKSENWEGSPAQ